jgi:choline/ethanolamine kinase
MCGLRDGFNNDTPNKVLLRFYYNPDKDNSITDTIVFALLSERKIGPKLYGLFNEGRIEEYIDSRPLMTHELADPKISIEIGRRLARIHKLKIPISKQPNYMHDAFERYKLSANLIHLFQMAKTANQASRK